MINRKATIRWKGYDPADLSPGSGKKIWAVCNECGKGRWLCRQDYHDLCHKCGNNTKEHCNKISISAKNRLKDKSNHPMFGKHHSEETKRKICENHADISDDKCYWYGKEFSSEHRKRISDAKIEYFSDPINRKSLSNTVIEQMNRPGTIDKIKELHNRPDVVERHSLAMKEINSRPEVIAKRRASMIGRKILVPFKNTSIELKIQQILKRNGYQFSTHVPLCGICVPDIVFEFEKIAIFCDGDYWHNYPDGNDRDHEQDRILKENGWKVIRF